MSTKIKNKATGEWEEVAALKSNYVSVEMLKSSASETQSFRVAAIKQGSMVQVTGYGSSVEINQGDNYIAKLHGIKPVGIQELQIVQSNNTGDIAAWIMPNGIVNVVRYNAKTAPAQNCIFCGCFISER